VNLEKFLPLVKDQAVFHEKMASRFGPNSKSPIPWRAEKHAETGAQFKELALAMEEAARAPAGVPGKPLKPHQLSLSFDEIQGLPDELLQELSFSEGDKTDYTILKTIEDAGGIASLDRILVSLYRETGEVMKRNTLTSRTYRMAQKGLLFSVPGKKGVYSTRELTETEVSEILGI
jgi:hypothetical protein